MPGHRLTEEEVPELISEVIANARRRQEIYLPRAAPLTQAQKEVVRGFFPDQLLENVRALQLVGKQVPNPEYYERAKKRGHRLMLDFRHMPDITHPQLMIFQGKPSSRLLFHALVHVTQYAVLGLESYLELYVRAFLQTGNYASVPLEAQAFRLDQRYTEDRTRIFSVEKEVRDWAQKGKYVLPPGDEMKLAT